jgi:hypothetical protein
MSTFNDIRSKFESIILRESNLVKKGIVYSPKLAKEVERILSKMGRPGNKKQDLFGLRFGISGDPVETEKYISNVIFKNVDSSNYRLSWFEADRAKKGEAQSGTFNTHKIMIVNPTKVGKYLALPGDQIYIIDNLKAKSNIQNKMLTPDGLGLSGGKYLDTHKLRSHLVRAFDVLESRSVITPIHSEFMFTLFDDVVNNTKKKYNSVLEIPSKSPYVIDIKSDFSGGKISQPDIDKISKDFGEILGGAYLLCLVGPGELGLQFPYDSNEPMVDFYLNGQAISMKSGAGAAPSLANVGNVIRSDYEKWTNLMSNEDQKLMLDIVLTFHENEAMTGLFKVAELLNAPGWHLFKTLMGDANLKAEDIDKKKLNSKIIEMFEKTPDEAYDLFNAYFKGLNKFPDGWENKDLQIQNAIERPFPFGLVMSPLAYHVKDELNSNEALLDALEEVMQKFDVLQLYIDLKVGKTKSYQKYTIIPFAEGRFKFHSTTSVNQPTRNKFSVKMIK